MKKIIIIVAVVLVLGGAAAAFFILFGGDDAEVEEPIIRVPHQIGLFTSNVRDARGAFFRIELTVVANTEDDSVPLLLYAENARVRHTILFLLRAMTTEDFNAPDAEVLLARRIVTALNDELEVDYFVDILFTEYVIA